HLKLEFDKGLDASDQGDYSAAKVHFDTAVALADRLQLNLWGYLAKLRNYRHLGSQLTEKARDLPSRHELEELKALAHEKSMLAERIGRARGDADALASAADGLRFRLLLGEGTELAEASRELQALLAPFYVLESSDWTTLEHSLPLLNSERRERLLVEANELLFLWMAAIDESLAAHRDGSNAPRVLVDQASIERAVSICERASVWVEARAPWAALQGRLEEHLSGSQSASQSQAIPLGVLPLPGEPRLVAAETSALACYQWGLLCHRVGRRAGAIDWLQRATRLKWDNYWYQFMLAYLEDRAGPVDAALDQYSVAVALKPESPGVRFSRARLYRSRGRWDWALDDLGSVLPYLSGSREKSQVHLELGYLYQELGNFPSARSEY